ncbi:fatty acid--CoA ligase [Altererythrobacter sp. MF3-039]|uniref:fatty acid--CoA ligase n=1 Tax=Altererythrobacter sp. MF3-039 TaxID=3252901 RepID=UPI00390C85A1
MSNIDDPQTIGDLIRHQARELGDQSALSFEGDHLSFRELDEGSNRAANALLSLGVERGDRISYLGKNSHLYFQILAGAAKIGAVMTPVNWRLAKPEVIYVLNDCQAKVLFIGPGFDEQVAAIEDKLEHITKIIGAEGPVGEYPGYPEWRDEFDDTDPHVPITVDDDAIQLYTSGTTGYPKGAVLTHGSIFSSRMNERDDPDLMDWQRPVDGEVSMVAMPCFHIAGTGFGLSALFAGSSSVVLSEYDPTQALDLIENYNISKIFMVPAAIQILLNHPRVGEVDFSNLKYIFYGASPIPLELMKQAMDVLGCGFVQMYGMTETSGTIVTLNPEDHDPKGNARMRSVGTPLKDVEIKVIDEEGNDVPTGTIGEIATRSPKNMKGYWNRPEASEETIDKEGWLRTGDAGYLDEDGYLYIQDRVKDMIISGGENVYPAEVENALYAHPKVADVAVIGIPSEKWGEEVKACVVVKPGEELSEAEIIAHARENIAGYKCPKSIDFIPALPRNPSGKILRKDLRAPYWDGKARNVN